MGFFLSLALGFIIVHEVIGVVGAAISCAIFLVGWFMFNRRALTTGLIESDMRTYFNARSKGANHQEAMDRVIRYRYPFSQQKRSFVKSMSGELSRNGTDEDSLKALIYVIFCQQSGRPPIPDCGGKIILKIDDIYDSISSQYGKDTERNR